jgi:LuxR family maltose regulon positive regulatory protein
VLAGWITSLSGDVVPAQRLAAVVDAASYELVPLDGSASFDSARAMWRAFICPAGPEQMLLDADLALEQEPPWSPWRDNALVIAGEAYLLNGDLDRAVRLFTESSALSAVNNNTDSLVLSETELALVAMDRGQWTEAAEHLERAQTTIDEHRLHDYVTCLLAFAAAARLAVHRGDLKTAELELTRAMRARVSLTWVLSWLSVSVRLQLAKVYSALGEQTTARHLLREIDDIMLQRPRLGVLVEEVAELRQLLTASAQGGAGGGSPLSPAELRLLPYLQTHLTYREIAERLFVSRNTVSTEVSSIFRKLGASSRGEAVQRATSIGLLGG